MQKRHIWLRASSFLLLGAVLFTIVQEVLTPDWRYPKMAEGPEDMITEFDTLDREDNIQALFLGTSSPEYGIDPMQIYKDSRIATFNLASSNQPIEVSYYLLERAFNRFHPKYVFFDVAKLFEDVQTFFNDASYRYILDSLPMGKDKIKLAKAYALRFSEDKWLGAFIGAFFSIYEFHERWKELSAMDFTIPENRNFYRKGYYSQTRVQAVPSTIELMNEIAEANYNNTLWVNSFVDGAPQSIVNTEAGTNGIRLYQCEIQESAVEYLLKMKALCEENNSELIMIKIPQIYYPQYYASWTRLRSDAVKAAAEEYRIRFLDFVYDIDCGMDYNMDSSDGGAHLNYLGASKISSYLAGYLLNELKCLPSLCDDYDDDLPIYDKMCQLMDLIMTADLIPYLEKLKNWENVTVFFSASDDMMLNLSPESRQALNDFGLQTNFDTLSYNDSFLAIKEEDKVVYEAASNQSLVYGGVLQNGVPYTVTSCGWRLGTMSQIIVGSVNYSQNMRGINIVVYDNVSGLVLDRVAFDTYGLDQRAVRTNIDDLRVYEEYLMRLDAENGIGV